MWSYLKTSREIRKLMSFILYSMYLDSVSDLFQIDTFNLDLASQRKLSASRASVSHHSTGSHSLKRLTLQRYELWAINYGMMIIILRN